MKKINTLEEFMEQVQNENILAELKQLKKTEVNPPPLRWLGYNG